MASDYASYLAAGILSDGRVVSESYNSRRKYH